MLHVDRLTPNRQQQQSGAQAGPQHPQAWVAFAQIGTFVLLAIVYSRFVWRLCWQGYGWEAVVLSPGFAWLLPLHVLALGAAWAVKSDKVPCLRAKDQ